MESSIVTPETSESKSLECKYCNTVFKARNGLSQHLRTIRACIDKQEKDGIKVKTKFHTCESCKKEFSSSSTYKYHVNHCKEKIRLLYEKEKAKNEQLLSFQEKIYHEIHSLKNKVDKIATPVATTTNIANNTINSNNTTNHITIQNWMTEERVMEIFRKSLTNVNQLNPKELASFTVNHLVNGADRPLYLCTDPSRQRMVYFDGSGNEMVDENCKTLIDHVMQAKPYVSEIVQDHIMYESKEEIEKVKPLHDTFSNLQRNRTYKIELSKQLPRTVERARTSLPSRSPTEDKGVDWDINDKLKEDEPQVEQRRYYEEDNLDFFPAEAEDD